MLCDVLRSFLPLNKKKAKILHKFSNIKKVVKFRFTVVEFIIPYRKMELVDINEVHRAANSKTLYNTLV
jgi:hypothetical protein